MEWSAIFVTWVAEQAGYLSQGRVPNTVRPLDMFNWYKKNNKFKATDIGYIPQPGDLIFFDWKGNKTGKDQVGIVEFTGGNTIQVIEDRVNSHIKFKSSIDPVARAEYKTHLIDAKIQAQNAKKGVSALDVGNTMSRKGELSKLTDLTKHAIPQAKRLTAQNQRIIGGNTLTKGLQGQLLQAPVR